MRLPTDVLIRSNPRGQYTLVNATTLEPLASPFYSLPDVARVAQNIANLRNVRVWSQTLDDEGEPIGDARLFAPVSSRERFDRCD
jgi:hypothetical protein